VAGMLLSLIYLKMVQLLKPFTDPAMNRIKETSIWQIFFVFLIALLLNTNAVDSVLLTVCLMLVFLGNLIILLGQYLVQYLLRYASAWCGVRMQSGGVEKEVAIEMKTIWRASLSVSPPGLVTASADNGSSSSNGNSSSSSVEDKVTTDDTDEIDRQRQIRSPFHPQTSL
jgi:hypothetical protein